MRKRSIERTSRYIWMRTWRKRLIIAAIIFLGVSFLVYLKDILRNLVFFQIKDVVVNSEAKTDLSYLKGRNIFDLDLVKEAEYIATIYPGYKKIRLVRVLPNRLFVDFVKRKPKAIVQLYRYFNVDEELVLFDLRNEEGLLDLPLILGLETKIFGPKPGVKYNVRELEFALAIIKALEDNNFFKDYKLKKVNVASVNNATCILSAPLPSPLNPQRKNFAVGEILQIKCGQDRIKDKIDLLAGLLPQIKNNLAKINYIDLRFKEAVIRFKDDRE